MSYIESPTETVRKFAQTNGWKTASPDELINDFFSISSETNLTWDQYIYEERDGTLFDPVRKRTVRGTAFGDSVEEGVNNQLEKWFLSNDSGIAVWISPRGNGTRPYPEEKIAIHRISYKPNGQKVLLCSSHQFKTEFRNPEDIRKFIFTEDDSEESVFEIIAWLKKISEKSVELNPDDTEKRRKQAIFYANQFSNGTPIEYIVYHMEQTGFLGQNPISCGGGNKTTTPSNTESLTVIPSYKESLSWHPGTCRVCGASTWVGPCDICKPCESNF